MNSLSKDPTVAAFARARRALPAATAELLARTHGVTVADVVAAHAAQQQALTQGIHDAERAGQLSEALRSDGAGGPFHGQPTTDPARTPALKGSNLVVPGDDVRRFKPLADAIEALASRATQLTPEALSRELRAVVARAPRDMAACTELWGDVGDALRARMMRALDALAQVAPDAVLYVAAGDRPVTVQRASLEAHMSEALENGDPDMKERAGRAYLDAFPTDVLAPFARSLVEHAPSHAQYALRTELGGAWAPAGLESPLLLKKPRDPQRYDPITAKGAAALAQLAYKDGPEVEAALAAAGYRDVQFIRDPLRSTEVLVAVKDDCVVVAFRGSQELRDWGTDLLGGAGLEMHGRFGGQVHGGFSIAYDGVDRRLMEALARAQHGSPKPIVFSGHSLGGALAQLAASDAAERGLPVGGVYTFGQPRVGDADFGAHYKKLGLGKRTFRHVNASDKVPRVPGIIAGKVFTQIGRLLRGEDAERYRHVGNLVYFDDVKVRYLNPRTEKLDELAGHRLLTQLQNHRVGHYVENLEQQRTHQWGRDDFIYVA